MRAPGRVRLWPPQCEIADVIGDAEIERMTLVKDVRPAWGSVPPRANVPCTPHRAPPDMPADLAFGRSGHANTINSCPTNSASDSDLRDHRVRLMKRRWRHGLRRRCQT
jgi:hypothetical protein